MKTLKLVKFGHEHCNPCKLIKPLLQTVAENFKDELEFVDRDTYEMSPEELQEIGIRAVPLLILYKDGVEVFRHVGLTNQAFLEQKIKDNL